MLIFAHPSGSVESMSQLPAAFDTALAEWQAEARKGPPGCRIPNCEVPSALTLFYVTANASHLLLHATGRCSASEGSKELERCRAGEREASELDMAAALRMAEQSPHGADPVREEQEQGAWLAEREKSCSAAGSGLDCVSQHNEARAAALLAGVPPRNFEPPASTTIEEAGSTGAECVRRVPVYDPDPHYSDAARRARIEGTMNAQVTIAPDGHVVGAVIQKALGYGLDEEAVQALLDWRFQPLPASCRKVNTVAVVSLNFRLGRQWN